MYSSLQIFFAVWTGARGTISFDGVDLWSITDRFALFVLRLTIIFFKERRRSDRQNPRFGPPPSAHRHQLLAAHHFERRDHLQGRHLILFRCVVRVEKAWHLILHPPDIDLLTASPTRAPTALPTAGPTPRPTRLPTKAPTPSPTAAPSPLPTDPPTKLPSQSPSYTPTKAPSSGPTDPPSKAPTRQPSKAPTEGPTDSPTKAPTLGPSRLPTSQPSAGPTQVPTTPPTQLCRSIFISGLPAPFSDRVR